MAELADALGSGPSGIYFPWRFESSLGHSTGLHRFAPGRRPLQNRGFLLRGQPGLRPRASKNGGLLHRISHRFFEVVASDLQVVPEFRKTRNHAVAPVWGGAKCYSGERDVPGRQK